MDLVKSLTKNEVTVSLRINHGLWQLVELTESVNQSFMIDTIKSKVQD
jgi:hypothetical protein